MASKGRKLLLPIERLLEVGDQIVRIFRSSGRSDLGVLHLAWCSSTYAGVNWTRRCVRTVSDAPPNPG
jgi:hypothetical protein